MFLKSRFNAPPTRSCFATAPLGRKEKMKKILLAIILLFSIVQISYCQEQPLQLTIKSDKEIYKVGEEVALEITLNNKLEKELILFWSDRELAVFSEEIGVYNIAMYVQAPTDDTLYIKPKDSITKTITINLDNRFKPLKGKIGIVFLYSNLGILGFEHREDQEIWQGTVTSNPITIEVVEKKEEPPQLTIQTSKKIYRIGEEIIITAEFRNISNEEIIIPLGRKHFSSLNIFNSDNKKIQLGVLYDVKDAWLGFFKKDYKYIKPGDSVKILIIGKIARGNNRELFAPLGKIFKGIGIESENLVYLIEKADTYQINLLYNSAIRNIDRLKKLGIEDVWIGSITSDNITIEIVEAK